MRARNLRAPLTLLLLTLTAPALAAEPEAPRYGKAQKSIGTFDGWSFWIGYDASFSKSYTPNSESYAWVVHFAPEAIYVSQQKGKALYSGVDVNAGYDYFFGLAHSPTGQRITRDYFGNLSAVTFSLSHFGTKGVPFGAMSNVSFGFSSSLTCYRDGQTKKIVPGVVQLGAGFTVAYNLVPNPLPFGVALGTESSVEAGFYPVLIWKTGARGGPLDRLLRALGGVAQNPGKDHAELHLRLLARLLLAFFKAYPQMGQVRAFVKDPGGSELGQLLQRADRWSQTGNTRKLPQKLRPNLPPRKAHELLRSLNTATKCGFQAGYYRALQVKKHTITVWGDCMKTVRCRVGKACVITVPAAELQKLVPGSTAAQFERTPVLFELPPDLHLTSRRPNRAVRIKGGRATLSFVPRSDTPLLLELKVPRSRRTGGKILRLCTRQVRF